MNPRVRLSLVIALLLQSASMQGPAIAQLPPDVKSDIGPDVPKFRVRPGYKGTRAVADKKLRNVRFLQFSQDGKMLFVSNREDGMIYLLRDPDGEGVFQTMTTFVK